MPLPPPRLPLLWWSNIPHRTSTHQLDPHRPPPHRRAHRTPCLLWHTPRTRALRAALCERCGRGKCRGKGVGKAVTVGGEGAEGWGGDDGGGEAAYYGGQDHFGGDSKGEDTEF